MKKYGFTLAEVLITMSIIGVVAAMTLPSLIDNVHESKIGPKLAKFRANLEQANINLLNANSVDYLSDAGDTYSTEIKKYMKLVDGGDYLMTPDGVGFTIVTNDASASNEGTAPNQRYFGMLTVDINGPDNSSNGGSKNKPNVNGDDIFYFTMWNDGSLRPKGGQKWAGANTTSSTLWTTKCPNDSTPSSSDAAYCTGSIFENNLKVKYKLD